MGNEVVQDDLIQVMVSFNAQRCTHYSPKK